MTDRGVEQRTTARQRIIGALAEHPDGLSGSQLHRESGVQRGAFRRIIDSLVASGEVEVEERDTKSGKTRVHTLYQGAGHAP